MDWSKYKYFKESEFSCKHCGKTEMNPVLIHLLDDLRDTIGFPIKISSGYRCPEHNKAVSSTGEDGPHTTGSAADVLISGPRAREFLTHAVHYFNGIGVNQKGPMASRFIHVDLLEKRLWTY